MRKIIVNMVLGLFAFSVTTGAAGFGRQASVHADPGAALPRLVISELQTTGLSEDGSEDGTKEFVEVYNPSLAPLDANGWKVEYLSAGHNGSSTPTRILGELDFVVDSASYVLLSSADYLPGADKYFGTSTSSSGWIAKSGGHVRIVSPMGQTVDAVSWGSAVPLQTDPPVAWWLSPVITAGKSIQRLWLGDPGYMAGLEFSPPDTPTPYGGNIPLPPDIEPPLPDLPGDQVVLSEILPNPDGADGGQEFIEVHNPTQSAINLEGCSLRLGDTGKPYELPDELLPPNSYRAFYDTETDITLPNGTAQKVWLLGAASQQSVLYEDGMEDDQSWSNVDGTWQVGLPTPGSSNVPLPLPADSAVLKAEAKNKIPSPQTPCPAGKERNQATNRCRSVVSATSIPTPCKPGQERNLETNRCRSVLSSQTKQKPCPEGQERNATTNRCRKKPGAGAASLAQVQDVNSLSRATNIRWWIAGLVAAGAASYAVYEWRRDIGNVTYRMKLKYGRRK